MGSTIAQHKSVLWVIAARSGSKGIPDKNIKGLDGLPLIAYRIKTALQIAQADDVWVSTDSQAYAEIARHYGASVPFIRPEHLSTDDAKSADVVLHAMAEAEKKNRSYDAVGLLEPTSPFVKASTLVSAVHCLFACREAENIVATRIVCPGTHYIQKDTCFLDRIAANIANGGHLRRQNEHREITPSGGFYIAKWELFKNNRTFYTTRTLSYRVSGYEILEIDEPLDLEWAEFLVQKNKVNIKWLL